MAAKESVYAILLTRALGRVSDKDELAALLNIPVGMLDAWLEGRGIPNNEAVKAALDVIAGRAGNTKGA